MWVFSSENLYGLRSLCMVDLTVFLFVRFHVNGSREEIWNLVHNPF